MRLAAGDRAEMAGERLVFPQIVEAEHDVVEPAGAIGHVDLGNDAAQAQETHAEVVVVGHRDDLDRLPALRGAVRCVVERSGSAGRSAREPGRQCCGDRTGAPLACAGLALQVKAHATGQVCNNIPVPLLGHPLGRRLIMHGRLPVVAIDAPDARPETR